METQKPLAEMTIQELNDKALTAPRFLSQACSRMAAAKAAIEKARLAHAKGFDAIAAELQAEAKKFYAAAQVSYTRSLADESEQIANVRQVAAVVSERGATQKVNEKVVSSNRNFGTSFTWSESWGTK